MLKARAEMLIRRPVAQVFQAFVDPAVTSKFWFTGGSDKLEAGKTVKWDWEMYGFSTTATITAVEPDRRILVEWTAGTVATTIEWRFHARPDGTTYVAIENYGFQGDLEQVAKQAIGSTEGFAFVLAAAKAWLEHGIQLNLVRDKFPDGLPKS